MTEDISRSHLSQLEFAQLDLLDPVRAGIARAGFTHCTPIQALTLPVALAGKDVAGQAQTGTGKTAAFLLVIFQTLLKSQLRADRKQPRALVMAPTRELAVQIHKDAMLLGGPAPELGADPALLTLLREGMKAVPEVGTAAGAFAQSPEFRCRVYGKTGTAEIDKSKSFNSAWFIGWMEPAQAGERRLAFACMMTHATGPLRTGGGACAPIVNRMLSGVTGADQARKPTQ